MEAIMQQIVSKEVTVLCELIQPQDTNQMMFVSYERCCSEDELMNVENESGV